MSHDRDDCALCLLGRVLFLHRRRGLSIKLARQLRDAGTAALPQIEALEAATPDQIKALNTASAESLESR